MRSGLLAAIALALAGVAEVQWAIVLYGDALLYQALMLLIAGLGLGIAAFGFYADASGRPAATTAGIALAAAAHVAFIAPYYPFNPIGMRTLGAFAGGLGLAIATLGVQRGPRMMKLTKLGLGIATLFGLFWLVADVQDHVPSYWFGDVMSPIGLGLAAIFAGDEA